MSQRGSLRDFQENLARRLAGAAAQESVRSRLTVESGGRMWLLHLPDAGEVMPVPWLCRVPLTKRWYSGIVNVRGNLYGMVDFADFCGLGTTPRSSENALLLCGQRHGVNSGLLVSRVVGLRNAHDFKAVEATNAGKAWEGGVFEDRDGRRYSELNVTNLLCDPEFLNVSAV